MGSAVALSFTDLPAKQALGRLPLPLVAWARVALPVPLLLVAVKRTSLLWSILLGTLVLGERSVARRLMAGAVMLAGVACLAAA